MWQVIGQELPAAIGVSISIAPLIALIVILSGPRARTSGFAFALGWLLGVTGAIAAFAALGSAADASTVDSSADQGLDLVALGMAALFAWLAIRSLRNRPLPGEAAHEPKWLAAVDRMAPLPAFGIAAAILVVNVKNLPLLLAMGGEVARAGLSGSEAATTVIVLGVVCSIGALTPVIAFAAGGSASTRLLASWRDWLTANSAVVMAVLFTVLGAKNLGNAIGGML